jgi:hypothetical protein
LDNYVVIHKYENEMDGVKRLLDWQSSQLEALCMGGGMGRGNKDSPGNRRQQKASNTNAPSGGYSKGADPEQSQSMVVDDDEDEDKSTVYVLQKQLELLAMGTLWLSQLSLRQPELGCSRQLRLESEQELIGHLKNVRHWITHRSAPGDWDPSALLSSALQFTHPKDEELPGPLPVYNKPPGSANSFGRQRPPGSAGSTMTSGSSPQNPVTSPRTGGRMKREISAPLQTIAGLLGPSESTQSLQSLSAQSMPPTMRKDPSQSYFNSLPPQSPGKTPTNAKRHAEGKEGEGGSVG